MKKVIFIAVVFLSAMLTMSCTKEEIQNPSNQDSYINMEPQMIINNVTKVNAFAVGCAVSIISNITFDTTLNINNSITYDILGINGSDTMHYVFKDRNGGLVASTDTLQMIQVNYNICGTHYDVQTHNIPTITVVGAKVDIVYSDCLLPLNGLNGTIKIKFQQ